MEAGDPGSTDGHSCMRHTSLKEETAETEGAGLTAEKTDSNAGIPAGRE